MKHYRNIKLDSDERMNDLLMDDEFFDEEDLDLEKSSEDFEKIPEADDAAFVTDFDDEDEINDEISDELEEESEEETEANEE